MKKIHELITPETWCQNNFAQYKNPGDQYGVKWCALGWIHKVYRDDNPSKKESLLCNAIGIDWLTQWNDAPERTFEDVLNGFIKADL